MPLKINKNIFRAYDVRGIYGKDLTEDVMERIGNAFASLFVRDTVVVGMDGRVSGPALKEAFIRGVRKAGKNVIDAGLIPRGVCIFFSWKKDLVAAYITASHLTAEWNGVKFSDRTGNEFHEKDNYRVRDRVLSEKMEASPSSGKLEKAGPSGQYMDYILSKFGKSGKPLKVVLECGNGTGGLVAPELFRKLGFEVEVLFGDVDGRFPNRPSEIDEKHLGELAKAMKKADIGVAFDGDSDRMALMDDRGRLMGPESASFLIMQELGEKEKGPIIANVECLRVMDEIAAQFGRKVYRVRVGNSFMVEAVLKKKACFGVERSGHFCIPSVIPMDDGIAASIYAAMSLAKSGKKLSEISDSVPMYPFKRVKADCPDGRKFAVIERLTKRLSREYENVNTIDGVRVDFDYGWILIRASNTGPVIRLSIEANDEQRLEELERTFTAMLMEEIGKS